MLAGRPGPKKSASLGINMKFYLWNAPNCNCLLVHIHPTIVKDDLVKMINIANHSTLGTFVTEVTVEGDLPFEYVAAVENMWTESSICRLVQRLCNGNKKYNSFYQYRELIGQWFNKVTKQVATRDVYNNQQYVATNSIYQAQHLFKRSFGYDPLADIVLKDPPSWLRFQ